MHLKKLLFVSLLPFYTCSYAQNNSLSLNVNNEDIEVEAAFSLNNLASYSDGTDYLLSLSYLNTDKSNITNVGILGQSTLQGVEALTLSFGLKAVVARDFVAVPFAFKAAYALPLAEFVPTTSLIVDLSYAPSTLTFREGKSYSDARIEANMEIVRNINIFAGYRSIKTNYKLADQTFNKSSYVGIKFTF